MPQCVFYIDEEKQQCLSASWGHDWKNFKLLFQDEVVCSFVSKGELASGRKFVMPDGHLLSVRLKGTLKPELEILRDGLPLPCKQTYARSSPKTVFQLAIFLGVLNITSGVVAAVIPSDVMLSIGLGYGSVVVGAGYLLLAWALRSRPSFAFYAIAAVIALDMVLLYVFTSIKDGPSSPTSGLLIKLFLVYAFIKGLRAMKRIRAQAAETVT
ncbi:hypothetical protein GCM10027443_23540 [Pontibacter brevis]